MQSLNFGFNRLDKAKTSKVWELKKTCEYPPSTKV